MNHASTTFPPPANYLPSMAHSAATIHHLPQRHSGHLPLLHAPVLTQFGEVVDVRRRGALRIRPMTGAQRELETPAVVRLWHEQAVRELSASQARSLAAQLMAAADLVDGQNSFR